MREENYALLRKLEAIFFVSPEPLEEKELLNILGCTELELSNVLLNLEEACQTRGVILQRLGDGWAMRTAPDLASMLHIERDVPKKLSRAATETLAIIAYHQPVTRAEIEEVRGVAVSKGTLDLLLELGWIKPGQRREIPGRPLEWHTSDAFLDYFDLSSLSALPRLEELRAAGLLSTRTTLTSMQLGADGEDISTQGLMDMDRPEEDA